MYEDFLPTRLSALREQKGISARDMSLSIGQNPGYVNNIETGKALPSMTLFFYICEYLKITPAEFFDSDSKYPEELRTIIENLKKLNEEQLHCVDYIVKQFTK